MSYPRGQSIHPRYSAHRQQLRLMPIRFQMQTAQGISNS